MAWSVKLQSGSGGVSNYNEWEMIFNPSTQTAYKATYNISLGSEAPDVLYHTPDNGAPVPIRATGRNRVLFLELHIPPQTSWDNVLNKIAPIARLVDGPDSQAMRSQTAGADAVRVAIKPDGATYTTYFDVLHGFIDTSQAFTQDVSMINVTAYRVVVALTCKPFGYGSAFTLRNDLASSPHMIEDSNADGLADGLTHLGTPTTAISTTYHLIGGKSQSVVTDATEEGVIASYSTSGKIGDTCAVKGYVNIKTAAKRVTCQLRNGYNVVLATASMPADAVRTIKGPDNDDWYEFNLTGTASATNGFQVYVFAPDANVTFLVDGLYLQTGTLTVPAGWASSAALKNRYDPVSTSAATRQQINYLDVWGVPGDVPALVEQALAFSTSTTGEGLIVGKVDIPPSLISSGMYQTVKDSADMTGGAGWGTTGSSAISIGGSYLSTPNPPSGTGTLVVGGEVDYLKNFVGLVYLMCRKTHSSGSIAVTASHGAETITIGTASPANINTWSFVEVGSLNITGTSKDFNDLEIYMTASGSSGVVSIDALWIFPTDEFLIANYINENTFFGQFMTLDGIEEMVWGSFAPIGYTQVHPLGTMWKVTPGTAITRYVYFRAGTQSTALPEPYAIANTTAVTLTVTPRTAHLLGTV